MQPFTFFISYRRESTAPIALLLKSEIEKRLEFVRVSVDVEDIRPGERFPQRLRSLLDKSHAVIALIGRGWMASVIDDVREALPPDWVIEELVYARTAPFTQPDTVPQAIGERKIVPLFFDCDPDFRQFALPQSLSWLAESNAERIDHMSWPRSIGPLLDKLAVDFFLKKRPDADGFPEPHPAKARTQPLSDSELTKTLGYYDYAGWYVDNFGDADARYLVQTFKFSGFDRAAKFMSVVSDYCRLLQHHPEWRNVYQHVTVSLTTWDAKRRVTIYDLNLALFMNKVARRIRDGKI